MKYLFVIVFIQSTPSAYLQMKDLFFSMFQDQYKVQGGKKDVSQILCHKLNT